MYAHYIGIVQTIKADDLEKDDVILFNGEYRSISAVKKEGNIVRVSFNFRRMNDEWDMNLPKRATAYRLGTHRITGMEREDK